MRIFRHWLSAAAVFFLISGVQLTANAQAGPVSRSSKIVCSSNADPVKARTVMESKEFRAQVERMKSELRAKLSESDSQKSTSIFLAKGRIFSKSSGCSKDLATSNLTTALPVPRATGVTTQGIISPDPTDPDVGAYYDLGEYGQWEYGDYMNDSTWWMSDVINPVWTPLLLVANTPSQECRDEYSGCTSTTKYLKSGAMVACGSLVEVLPVAAACAAAVEYLSEQADNHCVVQFAKCVANQ